MKLVSENINKCLLFMNDTIEMLQLSRHYKFKPYKDKLQELIFENAEFCEFVHQSKREGSANSWLSYVWREMGEAAMLFSWSSISTEHGKPAFFADTAALGNFNVYESFIESLNGNIDKQRQFSIANDGIFGLFGVFLRRDLAMKYVHHDALMLQSAETLVYVIQPQLLLEYKELLIEDCMFVLDDKDEWEMDVLKNPRYHPNERMKFLKMITNSTLFCLGLFGFFLHAQAGIDMSLAQEVSRLYNSFDNFKKDWMLDEYPDLKDNVDKQKEIHEEFKYYIQYLFGIGKYYIVESNRRPGSVTAFNPKVDTMTQS